MQKPANWDTVEAICGGGKRLTPGGHVCKIVSAAEQTSRTGKQMLVLAFDIDGGEFDGYFMNLYNRNVQAQHSDAKWPNSGVYRQLTEGDSAGYFKGVLVNIEKSNPGYKWDWNEQSLKGKRFGGVFREEEYQANDGSIKTRIACIAVREVEGIEDIIAPGTKKLAQSGAPAGYIPDEQIPF